MTDALKDIVIPIATVVVSVGLAYGTAKYALHRERTNGRARLLDICRRYVLNFLNAFDSQTRQLRTDELAHRLYMNELTSIVGDLDRLLGNAYVEKLILKHPRVSILGVLLRRELIEHCQQASLSSLKKEGLEEVFLLNNVISQELGRRALRSDLDGEIHEAEQTLRRAGFIGTTPPNKPA